MVQQFLFIHVFFRVTYFASVILVYEATINVEINSSVLWSAILGKPNIFVIWDCAYHFIQSSNLKVCKTCLLTFGVPSFLEWMVFATPPNCCQTNATLYKRRGMHEPNHQFKADQQSKQEFTKKTPTPPKNPTKCSPSWLLLPLPPLAWPLPYQLPQVRQWTQPFKQAKSS